MQFGTNNTFLDGHVTKAAASFRMLFLRPNFLLGGKRQIASEPLGTCHRSIVRDACRVEIIRFQDVATCWSRSMSIFYDNWSFILQQLQLGKGKLRK